MESIEEVRTLMAEERTMTAAGTIRQNVNLVLMLLTMVVMVGGAFMYAQIHMAQQDWVNAEQDKRLDNHERSMGEIRSWGINATRKLDKIADRLGVKDDPQHTQMP